MDLKELLNTPLDELEHAGVKGMKWGKRKASYMNAVKKHESKTKADREKVAAHKAREKEQGKAAVKKYMDKVGEHEAGTKARRSEKAIKSKASKKIAKARLQDLSVKLSNGLNIAVGANDVYQDIKPSGVKSHLKNAAELEKYGIKYNP